MNIPHRMAASAHIHKAEQMLCHGGGRTRENCAEKRELLPDIFLASKDIRDKYVLSRLLWDLGSIDEFAEDIKNHSERNI